ncbi:dihydroneopterin aldolase [Chitinophaga cymbidii]|uniref:7,8-dihydroneopterin aldolase n=1 Tax=Chitinophaga cymbidii TaxID=1096750 RepID=A0A512RM68_9BACT|nr:dihydroneopterin aldolase [Chitinophaga cymbidii]GEP96798.1 7,8-dihydroneopterin aldolase [Chitinophaga cymbidii]
MLTIALEGLQFYAYHGLYQEEQIIGNHFVLDIRVSIPEPEDPESLSESVNYEVLHAIARQVMQTPQPLLEKVVHDISVQIKSAFPAVRRSSVTLKKQAPPLGGDVACSVVSLEKEY